MKNVTRLETLDDLVQHALGMGIYDATRKYRLESRTDTDMVDPQDGTIYTWDGHWDKEDRISTYKTTIDGVEIQKTENDLYQARYEYYYLSNRDGSWRSGRDSYISLSPQLGAIIEKMWPTEQKPWMSQPTLKATQYTLTGILKRLGKTDIEKQVKAVIAERTAIQEKSKRNNARLTAIRNLGEAIRVINQSVKEIPVHEYSKTVDAIQVAVAAVEATIEK